MDNVEQKVRLLTLALKNLIAITDSVLDKSILSQPAYKKIKALLHDLDTLDALSSITHANSQDTKSLVGENVGTPK